MNKYYILENTSIKFCKTCNKNNYIGNLGVCGYYWSYLDSATKCDKCGTEFENIDFPALDLKVLTLVSKDVNFIEAMIKLRQDNIIEYESRMSQFRVQAAQMEQIERQQEESSQIRCPYCQSKNINKITGLSKASSVVLWGIFAAGKVSKNYHCNNCKSDF